jgi:hypothetical protein
MATADFLDQKRHEIAVRLTELKPLVDEYQRLEAAAAALDGVATSTPASRRRAPQRSQATPARKRDATHGRRDRPTGSDTRAAQALALVTANPGITVPQIAEQMGIKQNYLYRVLPGLAKDGLVVKDGRGWKPAQPA